MNNLSSLKSNNLAEWTYERVQSYIQDFEENLNIDNQIGLKLVSFGNQGSFYIEEVGYWGPDIITFYCYDANNKARVQLIQNIAQLNILLIALPKIEEVKSPIGFKTE